MIKRLTIVCFLCWTTIIGYGQSTAYAHVVTPAVKSEALRNGILGVSVRTLAGQELIGYNSNINLTPASSQKLITTLSALQILGPEYKYETEFGIAGKVNDEGILHGNIIIKGAGDPTFASPRFDSSIDEVLKKMLSVLVQNGIKCIEGKIEIQTDIFKDKNTPGTWPLEDLSNYYGSGAYPFNYHENMYYLLFRGYTSQGQKAKIYKTDPPIPYLQIRSEVVTMDKNTGDNAYIYGGPLQYEKIVRGSIPYSAEPFKIKGSIPNPPLTFAVELSQYLSKNGLENDGFFVNKTAVRSPGYKKLHSFYSPPLKQIIEKANFESINLYCEALLRSMSIKKGKNGSIEAGVEVIEEMLTAMNADPYAYTIKDGSGLSPRNKIAPSTYTKYLADLTQKLGKENLLQFIPQAGVSGTVKYFLKGATAQKKFYLKSGSMGGVLSYTGFFQGKSGQWYSICTIANNHSRGNRTAKIELEKLFQRIYEAL